MTAYLAQITSGQKGSTFTQLIVKPVTFPVKIARIEWTAQSPQIRVARYSGNTTAGGTAVTPVPLRDGGPAATATSRYDVSSISGTISYFVYNNSTASPFTPPFELIVMPGSTMTVVCGAGAFMDVAAIYFEELRLAWSH